MPEESKQKLFETDSFTASTIEPGGDFQSCIDASSSTDRLVGSIFADKYEIQSRLGQGGMSIVYRAYDRLINRSVALKILLPGRELDERSIIRFQREARANGALDHVHIAKVYDFNVSSSGVPYLSMALIDGPTIATLLKNRSLKIDEAISLTIQICEGMQHAHEKGVLHRDLKPSNILLAELPNAHYSAQIADFGIAKLADNAGQPGLTHSGDIFGSPFYMSPEQALGEAVDARSDIYSVGCMLYEMLTGAPPFSASTSLQTITMQISQPPPSLKQGSLGEDFSLQLELLVARTLAKDKNERFQTMSELADALRMLKAPNMVPVQIAGNNPGRKASPKLVAIVSAVTLACAAAAFFIAETRVRDGGQASQSVAPPDSKETSAKLKSSEQVPPDMMLFGKSADQVFEDASLVKSGEDLSAEGLQVTDNGLDALRKVPDVTSLNLARTAVTDAGLKKLAVLKHLRELKLSITPIKGKGLKDLTRLPDLRELSICNMPQLESGSLRNLTGLDLFVLRVTGDRLKNQDVKDLAELTSLVQLELFDNPQLTDQIVPTLCRFTELRKLSLSKTQITDAGIKKLCERLTRLEQLGLANTKITDDSIGYLKKLKHLKVLELTGTKVDGGSIADFKEMKGMTTLSIARRRFKEPDLEKLKSVLPGCEIRS
jgi:serine/threonine protein kinase